MMSKPGAPRRSIDAHTHIVPPGWADLDSRFGIAGMPRLQRKERNGASIYLGSKHFRDVADVTFDRAARLDDMDRQGIDVHAISPIPIMFCTWAPAEAALALHRIHNDFIAGLVADHPDRFVGLGTVPMQAPDLAIGELSRLRSLGLSGIEIGTNVEGADLDAECYVDVLAAAAELGLCVFLHPHNPAIGADRMRDHYLPFVVGYPSDTCLALARLILSGVIERLPRLRLGLAHGGGTIVGTLGRIRHAIAVRPETGARMTVPIDDIVRRIFVDSITHDPDLLRLSLDRFGSGRVMLGSDYPFDMGVADPFSQLSGLELDEREALLHKSADAFFLRPPEQGSEPVRPV